MQVNMNASYSVGQLDTYSHKHVELLLYTSCTLLKCNQPVYTIVLMWPVKQV